MSDAVRSIRELLRDKAVFGWTMYDWANSAFATTIISTLSKADAVAYWAYTAGIALIIVALLSPIMGAIADLRPRKKTCSTSFPPGTGSRLRSSTSLAMWALPSWPLTWP